MISRIVASYGALALAALWAGSAVEIQAQTPTRYEGGSATAARPVARGPVPERFRLERVVRPGGSLADTIGMEIADVTGNGIPEIFSFGRHAWTAYGWNTAMDHLASLHHHDDRWDEPGEGFALSQAFLEDADGDGELEVLLIRGTSLLEVLDARTGRFEAAVLLPLEVRAMDVGQVEPGGPMEIVVRSADSLAVFRYLDPVPIASVSGLEELRYAQVRLGQADSDPQLEVIHQIEEFLPENLIIRDGLTLEEEWRLEDFDHGWGSWDVGDIDGDGLDEFVYRGSGLRIEAAELADGALVWSTNMSSWGVSSRWLGLFDIVGDGRPEVLAQGRNLSRVALLDGSSGSILLNHRGLQVGDHDRLGDVDGDCNLEWVRGRGPMVHFASLDEHEWEFKFHGAQAGPFNGLQVVDLDGDGALEVVTLVRPSPGSTRLQPLSFDLHSNELEFIWRGPLDQFGGAYGLDTGQFDGDPQLEYVSSLPRISFGFFVAVRDGITDEIQWSSETHYQGSLTRVRVADLDRDGALEVVAASFGTEGSAVQLFRFDGLSGAELAVSEPGADEPAVELLAVELDADPALELAVAAGTSLSVHDALDLSLLRRDEFGSAEVGAIQSLEAADADGDGDADLLLGLDNGELVAWDWLTASEIFRESLGGVGLPGLRLGDVDGDGAEELLATVTTGEGIDERTALQVRSWPERELLWSSGPMGPSAGAAGGMAVADADGDGAIEILVGGLDSIHVFEYTGPDAAGDLEAPAFIGVESAEARGNQDCCPWVDLSWSPARDALNPPVRYRVYSSTTPGFVPDLGSFLAETTFGSFRDATVEAVTQYHYVVRSVDALGNEDGNTLEASALTPPPTAPEAAPLLSVVDLDQCAATGVELRFLPGSSQHPLRFDLVVDGEVVEEDVVSPLVWIPADDRGRTYRIVTRYRACPLSASSATLRQEDRRPIDLQPATGFRLTDPDPCRPGRLRLRFVHPGFGWASGRHELWRDGTLLLDSVSDAQEVAVPDQAPHDYEIRSYDESCGQERRSEVVPHQDLTDCTNPIVRVSRSGSRNLRLDWDPFPSADRYNAYFGRLSSLWDDELYDHASTLPGLAVGSSPTPGDGCDAAGGPNGTSQVLEPSDIEGLYALVVSVVSGSGEQEYGPDSSGSDRREPTVDPRDLSFACP